MIDKAIDAVGSLTELARRMKVSPQVVANWRKRGIPPLSVLEVERATIDRDEDGNPKEGAEPKVTRYDLAPELYPDERSAA